MNLTNFSWVIDGQLAASEYPSNPGDLNYIMQQGIKALINLSQTPYRSTDDFGLKIHHIPIPDFSTPSLEQVEQIFNLLQHYLERKEPVLIHCFAGCGRTGTILALWLAKINHDKSPENIIRDLREIRPCSLETIDQQEFVIEYVYENLR